MRHLKVRVHMLVSNVPVRFREKQKVLKNNGRDIAVLWTALFL